MTPIGLGLGARSALGYGLGVSAPGGALPAWWYVAGKTSVMTYQPKGAASYAASKVNLVNPGTNNATDGTAYPTWDAATGWTGGAGKYLKSGLTLASNDQTYSYLVRFANAANGNQTMLGFWKDTGTSYVLLSIAGASFYYGTGSKQLSGTARTNSGVLAVAGRRTFVDGVYKAEVLAGTAASALEIYLMALNYNGSLLQPFLGDVQAIAIYSDTLTDAQVATVSAAMAAL